MAEQVIPSSWPVGSRGWLADAERELERLLDLWRRQWRWCDEKQEQGLDVTEAENKTIRTSKQLEAVWDAMQEALR